MYHKSKYNSFFSNARKLRYYLFQAKPEKSNIVCCEFVWEFEEYTAVLATQSWKYKYLSLSEFHKAHMIVSEFFWVSVEYRAVLATQSWKYEYLSLSEFVWVFNIAALTGPENMSLWVYLSSLVSVQYIAVLATQSWKYDYLSFSDFIWMSVCGI